MVEFPILWEIPWSFIKCREFCRFLGLLCFQFLTVSEWSGRCREAWKPQYSYRNIKVFSMGPPGNLQMPPKSVFTLFFADFPGIMRKWWNFGEFKENSEISAIFRFLGFEAAQTFILAKENKGFVKGCGIQQKCKFHGISWISWNFLISIVFYGFSFFHGICKNSIVQRGHAKT